MVVVDSSPIIALIDAETGGDHIQELIDEADVPIYVHAINMAEVFYHVLAASTVEEARSIVSGLMRTRIVVRSDMDTSFW